MYLNLTYIKLSSYIKEELKLHNVGGGGTKILQKIMAPPLPVIKLVTCKYLLRLGRGGGEILQNIMAPPLPVIKIVKYCCVFFGGGALRGAPSPCHQDSKVLLRLGRGGKILQNIIAPPLPIIKIVKYCCVWGGEHWGVRGAKILQKIMAPPLPVMKIVKYSSVGEGSAKILQQIMAPSLSVVKIIKYCGQKYIAYKQYNCILPFTVTN